MPGRETLPAYVRNEISCEDKTVSDSQKQFGLFGPGKDNRILKFVNLDSHQSCKSSLPGLFGSSSGLSLSKCFGSTSGLHTK